MTTCEKLYDIFSPAEGTPTFNRFFSSIQGKGRNRAIGKDGMCFLKRMTNKTIMLTPRAMEVDMAAPSAPMAGKPNLPKIRE